MFCGEHGLHLCELPTGYGKTYNVVHAMKEYLADPDNHRKIIYLTTLNKNLPEKELLSAFDNDGAAYRRNEEFQKIISYYVFRRNFGIQVWNMH